jgi:hypothetical protein
MPIYRIFNSGGFQEYLGIPAAQPTSQIAEGAVGGEGAAEGERKAGAVATLDTVVADNAFPTRPGESSVVVSLRGGEIVGSHFEGSRLPDIGSRTFYSRLGN